MRAEKPATIEVSVGKAKLEEMPTVMYIYRKHGGDTDNVGPNNTYVARNASGVVVGALSVFEAGYKSVVIRTGGIDPGFERRGVGRQLFGAVIEELKKEGYRTIAVAHQNKSQEFFSKLGFQERNPSEMVLEL